MIHLKQKRQHHQQQRPRLDRRNAIKNIDYDADASSFSSPSSSSNSFDDRSVHKTRSLDIFSLSDQTSFRVEGVDGEFDRICRSLGLSGPEDFSIPVAAWEARRALSPSSNLTLGFNDRSVSDVLSQRFVDGVKVSDAESKDEVYLNLDKSEALVNNVSENEVENKLLSNGGWGIKGIRPPKLSPPPVITRSCVDNTSSTWDIFRGFGPQDDRNLNSPVSSLVDEFEENEEVNRREFGKQEEIEEGVNNVTAVGRELSSDLTNDENDGDSSNLIVETIYSVSPNGSFRCSISSWQKGEFLGSGSFGTVYEGFTDDGFFFAVKEVSLVDPSQGQQSLFQLEQEISLLSQFQHNNIVRYLGTDRDDAKLYIFLELVTKGSLARLYQKYRLRDSQVSAYTRQILSGLNYLHCKDVVHRDIKCANILVDVSGSVKLADFGLAKATKLNDIKSCKGTPFWMAPEVVKARNHGYGHSADIWSLGCTVLEMLTGQIPYSHLEGMQALFRIGRGELPPIPDTLSRDAQDFILKCLQVNPDDRPTAAQLLEHPFVKKPPSTFPSPVSPHYYGMRL
ncbi:mitogen-activated protein kinase kinase kinase 1-like [Olea europaea var. sylvestris]|uniref:mitogen-activated protein kinase kinase kinase 1-like n=1 Tax=Olea europaea var. sylvestris TaxID=158386 RepID=UPI000C1D3599|nr:mitogen-activated protein kinase kinase kinase 1-like [Olea europaea var. sylvestris]